MNTNQAFTQIEQLIKKSNTAKAQHLEILKKVLVEIANEGIDFHVETNIYGTLKFFIANHKKPVNIRVASVTGDKKDHSLGYERFKITLGAEKYSFLIFAIENYDNLNIYIFRPSEISKLKSLNLRFKNESKYLLTRKSKYDKALRNWSILK